MISHHSSMLRPVTGVILRAQTSGSDLPQYTDSKVSNTQIIDELIIARGKMRRIQQYPKFKPFNEMTRESDAFLKAYSLFACPPKCKKWRSIKQSTDVEFFDPIIDSRVIDKFNEYVTSAVSGKCSRRVCHEYSSWWSPDKTRQDSWVLNESDYTGMSHHT